MSLWYRCNYRWFSVDIDVCPECGDQRTAHGLTCRFQVAGRQYRLLCRTTDKRTAEEFERAARAKREASRDRAWRERHKLSALREVVLARTAQKAATGRVGLRQADDYALHFRHLMRIMGDIGSDRILNTDILRDYVKARASEGVAGQTIRREIASLGRALTLAGHTLPRDWPTAKNNELLEPHRTHRSSRQEGHRHALADVCRWLWALGPDSEAYDVALLALLTGMRNQELYRIQYGWMRPASAGSAVTHWLEVPAEGTKSHKARTIGLPPAAVAILERRNKGDRPIFSAQQYSKKYRHVCAQLDIPAIHLRDLRTTHASTYAEHGHDMIALQAAMGHAVVLTGLSLAMTMRYVKASQAASASVAGVVWDVVAPELVAQGRQLIADAMQETRLAAEVRSTGFDAASVVAVGLGI